MNEKPTRDDYNELIRQLGAVEETPVSAPEAQPAASAPAQPDQGPDILAINRKREPNRAGAAPAQRPAAAQQPRRETQYSRAAQRSRAQSGQSTAARQNHTAPAQSRKAAPAGQRPASAQRPAASKNRTAQQRKPLFGRSGQKTASHAAVQQAAPAVEVAQTAPHRTSGRRGKEKKPGYSSAAWIRAIVISLILVALAVTLALFALASANDLFGLNQEDKQVEVNVTEGMSSGEIIDLLKETGVIDQKMTFRVYANLKDALEEFKPGQYVMNKNFSYDEVIIMLRTGIREDEERAVVTVTFYEGMTAWEIAERLEENKVCTAEEFINAVNTGDFSDYDFMSMIPDEELRFVRLEGFLFPDTYQFYVNENPENAVRRFLDNFDSKVTDDIISKLNSQNLSLYEGINLASIVQGESSNVDQMGNVSSVFHNRLDTPGVYPRLESDVSRDYVNNDIIPHVDIINQEQIVAYDSYQCEGLPVGPVNNPGLNAILAVCYPEDTPYFFFVTDAEGQFYYAVTFDEHVKNVYKAGLLGDTHGVATTDEED